MLPVPRPGLLNSVFCLYFFLVVKSVYRQYYFEVDKSVFRLYSVEVVKSVYRLISVFRAVDNASASKGWPFSQWQQRC